MENPALTVAGKAAQLDENDFSSWLDDRYRAVGEILDVIKGQVSEQRIEPLVATRIASCVVGSVFGYEEFHPRTGQPQAEQLLEMFESSSALSGSHR